ncbi:neuronal acetylcholine receptor subunit beta-3-like [Ostrea edulis]|uniref:neuronal acetylcholine receptor subunit beta-3-like n=1 Tax=Ostrea edulis TaxID=37623 RepID=UPI0024AEBC70|nr:neuronal acetylcholine receptor subunit beta-3-like [Ostrea edulis]
MWITTVLALCLLEMGNIAEAYGPYGVTLMNSLLANYHSGVRPRMNSSDAVNVNVTWTISVVREVNEKESMITMLIDIKSVWMDDFLTWNPQHYGNVSRLVFSGSQIWSPRLFVANKLGGNFLSKGFTEEYLEVTSQGKVTAKHTDEAKVLISFDTKLFPFDSQDCRAILQVSGYKATEVYLDHIQLQFSSFVESPLWVISNSGTRFFPYSNSQILSIDLTLRRKPLYYIFTMFGPSLILSILLLVAFFLPSDNGEKIMCGTTIFLSYVVFLSQLSNMLPEDSNNVPNIGVYYILLMISSAVMVASSIVVNFLRSKQDSDRFCFVRKRQDFLQKCLNSTCFVMALSCTIVAFTLVYLKS